MKGYFIMSKTNNRKFYKPCVANLDGEIGRKVMESIRNTPRSDHSEARKMADECIKSILAKQNER